MREIALHILDILQNAAEAGAQRVFLTIEEDQPSDRLSIKVVDDGRGMDAAAVERATDPFFTTRSTRHVGLGLPLFAAAAERAGGCVVIESQVGRGTTVHAHFRLFHPDRQPLGNLPDTLLAFLLGSSAPDLHYVHRVDDAAFRFDSIEVRAALGGVPLAHPSVRWWLTGYLGEGEAETYAARWQVASGF